jgi:nucleoside-diphosphate-sugar epimerase
LRVLVTGGNGLLGGYVTRELISAGHQVTSFARHPAAVAGATSVIGDITQLQALQSAAAAHEAIVHLAAIPGPNKATPERLMHINLIGTVNVLEAAVRTGVNKVVFASSGAATGFSFQRTEIVPSYLPIDEDHPAAPQDEYGLSKLLCEVTCKRYSAAYGVRTICLRVNHAWYIDRPGASFALSSSGPSSWARGLTVEELWFRRYWKVLSESNADWPVLGPPSPRNLLWAVGDARDVAQGFRLAVEDESIVHDVFAINADDTCSLTPSAELVDRYYPHVELAAPLDGFATLVSVEKAKRLLGYKPQFSWRRSDFQSWLDKSGLLNSSAGVEHPLAGRGT